MAMASNIITPKYQTTTADVNLIAVIFGVTGLVGKELAKRLLSTSRWKVYGVARRRTDFKFIENSNFHFISCDLLNQEETQNKLSPLRDATHLFWITWASKFPFDSRHCCEQNRAMMENALNAILPTAMDLRRVSLQTGMKHYFSFSDSPGQNRDAVQFYSEKNPRSTSGHNFYYVLEDLLREKLSIGDGGKVAWTVLRPGLILGSSDRTFYNFMGSLCVYGAICKKQNTHFVFGGTEECWEKSYIDGSDARLVAEQHIWVAENDEIATADGEAFNVINGWRFTWKQIWEAVGEKFGIETPEEMRFSRKFYYSAAMANMGKIWEEIVEEEGLVETKMEDLANWEFMDELFRCPLKMLGSRDKADQFGFSLRYETLDSILFWIDAMRNDKLIPFP